MSSGKIEKRTVLDEIKDLDDRWLFDLGHPFLNRVAESFVKAAGIGAIQAFTREAYTAGVEGFTDIADKSRISGLRGQNCKKSLEAMVKTTGRESLQWGMAAGVYSAGLTYGFREARGTHDWKDSAVAGAIAGAALALTSDQASRERIVQCTITGAALSTAAKLLARSFAILSGPTIPIIGEGDEEANDRHVEQLVASAEAATEEVIRRGVAHPNNIAVGGHSYGAFMTANLLAHAPHFFAVALPVPEPTTGLLLLLAFRMRIEHWEATSTYIEMSPFLSANKIKKPILLVHGEEDNNSGTLTMRSDLFFNALKGHGALCHLVILPFESHGYSARESIMHVLWETDMWLQKYCVNNSNEAIDHSSKDDNNSSERSIASAAVGAPDCENLHEDGFHHVSFVIRLEHFTLIGQVLNLSRSYNFRPYLRGPSSQVNLRSEVAPVAT